MNDVQRAKLEQVKRNMPLRAMAERVERFVLNLPFEWQAEAIELLRLVYNYGFSAGENFQQEIDFERRAS